MNRKKSLRQRLILTTVVIVTFTSTLFAGGVMLLKQQLEEVTFGRMVREHMQVLLQNAESIHGAIDPVFTEWQFVRGEDIEALPPAVRSLSVGDHHSVRIGRKHFQINIAEHQGEKVYLLYDISEWEEQEHKLLLSLLGGVLVVLALALFMATQAANSILAPVRRLTARLATIHPDQRNVRIVGDFEDQDIGQIAAAFDAYSTRIDQFVERERSFTAAASHELRTPLSVMMGAVDVIDSNRSETAIDRALGRMRRACGEMQAFIEATLFLSREQQSGISDSSSADLCEVVLQVIDNNQEPLGSAGIEIKTDFQGKPMLEVPESIAKIVVANLLRNAIEHTPGGCIEVYVDNGKLVVRDNGEGIASDHLPKIFDRSFSTKASGAGLGLNMVKRICDRFDWDIQVDSQPGEGTEVSVSF